MDDYVAGTLLIALGIWQYVNGHEHTAGGHDGDTTDEHHAHDHEHADPHDHDHTHGEEVTSGWTERLRRALPFVGSSAHDHSHDHTDEAADGGLYGMAALAFALGFTHNEEFDIIAICTGSDYCLE